jgi:glycosyltransferase involved in cell wall biosynthesis
MRILISNEALAGGGGVETYLSTVIPALRDRGHDLGVLHHNSAAEQGPTRIAPQGVWNVSVEDEGAERAFARAREWRPDVCFAHNMQYLDVEHRIVRTWPVVKMMHFYVGTCVSGQKAHTFPGVTPCSRQFGPACVALYLPRRCGRLRPGVLASQYRWASRQHAMLREYRAVVVASEHMAGEYARHGIEAGRLHTVPLFASDACHSHVPPIDGQVVFLGRLTGIKGASVLLRAVAAASLRLDRRVPVVIAGVGPELSNLRSLAATLKVNATFTGWIDARGRRDLLARAALVAVPSLWPEPFGLAGLEGAAFGVPAVAFDNGGIAQWLTDGVNGRLVPRDAGVAGLSEAIVSILSDDHEHRRLSRGAHATAARLSMDAHVTSIERILSRTAA